MLVDDILGWTSTEDRWILDRLMIFDVAAAAAADGGGGDGSDRHLYPNHRHHRWNLNRT